MQQIQNDMSTRNIVGDGSHPMMGQRSKKSLNSIHANSYGGYHQQHGNHNVGLYNPSHEGNMKVRNYYDMLEKNRRNEKMQTDLTKIYMVNNSGGNDGAILASSGSNGQYYSNKRGSVGNSPLMQSDGQSLLPNGNHFHNRNQSLDMVNSSKLKSKISTRKRPGAYHNVLNQDGAENTGDESKMMAI